MIAMRTTFSEIQLLIVEGLKSQKIDLGHRWIVYSLGLTSQTNKQLKLFKAIFQPSNGFAKILFLSIAFC
tara:strand:- start:142 stop:351 length:210 start_codon:yes stop_codon:yes gene_type:complete